jgi:predicted N-acetyltransferase YhbS
MTDNAHELSIHVRKMNEEDIESILEIDRKIVGPDRATTYSMTPTNYVGGELDISVVAEADGEIIGFLLGRVTDVPYGVCDSCLLELIGVDPQYKRRNVGRRMVKAFENTCRQKGICKIRVMVSWHDWWLLSFLKSLEFSHGEMTEFVKEI